MTGMFANCLVDKKDNSTINNQVTLLGNVEQCNRSMVHIFSAVRPLWNILWEDPKI